MPDFTTEIYIRLLSALLEEGYQTLQLKEHDGRDAAGEKLLYLRHDVDALPENALRMAQIEHSMGVTGTYYFRTVPAVYDEYLIAEVSRYGHEVGYHYENMDIANGDYELAMANFLENLGKLRRIVPIDTICMHGSPRSKYSNMDLWDKKSYSQYGIVLEAFKDIDYSGAMYITDTGRRWDGSRYSVRDKVSNSVPHDFRSTQDIIDNVRRIPSRVYMTIHPQRWNDIGYRWARELVLQNIKNIVKYMIYVSR